MDWPLESFVPVPNGSIYVKTWQPKLIAHRKPVLLLHDSLGCVDLWRDFPQKLADRLGRPVVAYDRLGFGRSTPRIEPPSMSFIAEEGAFVRLILDALEIPKCILFGYSVGGSMALCAAAQMPDRILAVISESAQAFVEQRTLDGVEAARQKFSDPGQVERLRRWHGERAEWILSAWFDIWTAPAYASWSLAGVLPGVKCPVLAIHGEDDDFGSTAFPELIAGHVAGPSTLLILPRCGHMPHREREDEVMSAIESFLNP